jgi:hypothetical protein
VAAHGYQCAARCSHAAAFCGCCGTTQMPEDTVWRARRTSETWPLPVGLPSGSAPLPPVDTSLRGASGLRAPPSCGVAPPSCAGAAGRLLASGASCRMPRGRAARATCSGARVAGAGAPAGGRDACGSGCWSDWASLGARGRCRSGLTGVISGSERDVAAMSRTAGLVGLFGVLLSHPEPPSSLACGIGEPPGVAARSVLPLVHCGGGF